MSSLAARFSEEDRANLRIVDPRIARVLGFLEANLHRPLSANDLARETGLSLSRFSHLFRLETGSSPARMLLRMRVTRAAELLDATGLPIKEIGARVGMENAGVFGRAFRSFYGMTPSEFRRDRQGRFQSQPGVKAEIVNK